MCIGDIATLFTEVRWKISQLHKHCISVVLDGVKYNVSTWFDWAGMCRFSTMNAYCARYVCGSMISMMESCLNPKDIKNSNESKAKESNADSNK